MYGSARWRELSRLLWGVARWSRPDQVTEAVAVLWAALGALPAWPGARAQQVTTARQRRTARAIVVAARERAQREERELVAAGWTLYRPTR
jgi:hypothetical protein